MFLEFRMILIFLVYILAEDDKGQMYIFSNSSVKVQLAVVLLAKSFRSIYLDILLITINIIITIIINYYHYNYFKYSPFNEVALGLL